MLHCNDVTKATAVSFMNSNSYNLFLFSVHLHSTETYPWKPPSLTLFTSQFWVLTRWTTWFKLTFRKKYSFAIGWLVSLQRFYRSADVKTGTTSGTSQKLYILHCSPDEMYVSIHMSKSVKADNKSTCFFLASSLMQNLYMGELYMSVWAQKKFWE